MSLFAAHHHTDRGEWKMNYSTASSGVSQRTEIMDAASGGELDLSPASGDTSRLCQKLG
jgi:hypothetical protein